MKPDMQSWDGNMHPNVRDAKTGDLRFNGFRCYSELILVTPEDLARETDWSKPDRPKIDGSFVKTPTLLGLGRNLS